MPAAVITAGASGLGKAMAMRFAREGKKIVLAGIELLHEERMRHAVQSGRVSAEQVADLVFAAIRDERFYILPHQKIKPSIETRMQDILRERTPTNTLDRPSSPRPPPA